MKTAIYFIIGSVGLVSLPGCSAESGGEAEATNTESDALVGLAKGIRHDFDGDGKEDIIFVTASGSYQYLGQSPGNFSSNTWNRGDLTLSNATYAIGDFNGDGKSDVIITTQFGSFEYTGKTGGGFNSDVWTNSSLTFGNVSFVVGDFNSDGKSDLLVTTASGTSLYTGKGTGGTSGGFNANVWSNNSWTLGNQDFVRGDFNGDGTTDLLITSSSGTVEYTGKTGTGGFNANVWSNTSFTRGAVNFTPADYNGDGKGDVVLQTESGAFLYYGKTGSGFTGGSLISADYGLSSGPPLAGDFNGDGKWDLLITMPVDDDGTGEILGTSTGFTGVVWDDGRFHPYDTVFHRGDYTGDGKDDFMAATTLNRSRGQIGTLESTGKGGSTGGFNSDVYVRDDLFVDNSTIY